MDPSELLEPAEMAARFFSALAERNLDAATTLFAERLDWNIPGNESVAPWLGERKNAVK